MDPPASRLEVGAHLPRGDEGVIRLGPIEILDPCALYHSEYEFPSLTLRGFEGRIIAVPGLVYRLLLGAYRCLLIVVYQRVVNDGLAWSGECGSVVRRVFCRVGFRVLYDPDEVMYLVSLSYSMARRICEITSRSSARCYSVGWPVMGSNLSRASAKRVEML